MKGVRLWIASLCAMIFMMIILGGVTRLTHSGLSIVQWKPITGILPPLSAHAWASEFSQYQQSPEYRLVNAGMSVAEFKLIFMWEYLHRLLARVIGLALVLPGYFFWKNRLIDRATALRLVFGIALGAVQGALGWFMVKSGLVDRPSVSHIRLAIHLGFGLVLLGYFFWLYLDLRERVRGPGRSRRVRLPRAVIFGFLALLAAQILYGALTAGLKAGLMFNTFPKMGGEWVPAAIFRMQPLALSVIENPVTVQWIHRILGSGVLAWVFLMAVISGRARLLAWAAIGQYALGIFVLLRGVPLLPAALHQGGACLLLLLAIRELHATAQA